LCKLELSVPVYLKTIVQQHAYRDTSHENVHSTWYSEVYQGSGYSYGSSISWLGNYIRKIGRELTT
jgi:hypothetical protein